MIKDSGERREFETGAVRDIQTGKGRCDLLPLDIVAQMFSAQKDLSSLFDNLNSFMHTKEERYLLAAVIHFCEYAGWSVPTALLEVAKHFEEGALKYAERNWEKGLSVHCYIDSGVRHLLKYLRGDEDEKHDRAFIWNMICASWTCKHKPELIDIPDLD